MGDHAKIDAIVDSAHYRLRIASVLALIKFQLSLLISQKISLDILPIFPHYSQQKYWGYVHHQISFACAMICVRNEH